MPFFPPEGSVSTGTVESVASANGSIVVTGGTGPDVDLAARLATDSVTGILSAANFTKLGALPGPWTTITVSSDEQDREIAIAGNSIGGIEIDFDIIAGSGGTSNLTLEPENLATNQVGTRIYNNNSTVTGDTLTNMSLFAAFATNRHTLGNAIFDTVSGRNRRFTSHVFGNTSGTVYQQFLADVLWTATATVLTKVRVHSSVANGIGTGSVIRWRPLNRGF